MSQDEKSHAEAQGLSHRFCNDSAKYKKMLFTPTIITIHELTYLHHHLAVETKNFSATSRKS